MSSEQLGTFAFLSIVVALAVAAVYFLGSRLRARRRPQREATWRELCLRLELVPRPGKGHVASGQLQGIDYSLHDVGKDWIVELPLDRPLLPAGVVLISPKAWRLRPPFKVRTLQWFPGMTPPSTPAWYANWEMPPSLAEASAPFLELATRAADAHEPLRVESRRLVHSLGTGDGLTVNEVRDAVRTLESTARHWLDVVASHGLPRVTELPRLPSALSLLGGVLAERSPWRALLLLNAGIPLTLGALLMDVQWLFFVLLLGVLAVAWSTLRKRRYGAAGLLVSLLMLASTFAAPWFWARSGGRGTTPSVLPVRAAADLPHRKAEFFRFDDAVLREDLALPSVRGPVPVVANYWTPGELVTVFAVRPPPPGQDDETLEGMAVATTRDLRRAAIQTALARGFPLHSHVLFVDFSSHPDTKVAGLRSLALLLWGFPNALWLGWVSLMWRRKVRQSRRESEDALSSERQRTAA
jgi:hypothetical protein